MKEGKFWGVTQLVTRNSAFEFHAIEVNAGGFCSVHRHSTKWNGFLVTRGRLVIRVWRGDPQARPDETTLEAGQYMEVAPGVFHQFEAFEACEAVELYWAAYSPDDIERVSQGGVRDRIGQVVRP